MAQTTQEASTAEPAGLACGCCAGPAQLEQNKGIVQDNEQEKCSDTMARENDKCVDSCCEKDSSKEGCAAEYQSTSDEGCGSCCDINPASCRASGTQDGCLKTQRKQSKSSAPVGKDNCQNACCAKDDSNACSASVCVTAERVRDKSTQPTSCCDANESTYETPAPVDSCKKGCCQPSEKSSNCNDDISGCCTSTNNQQDNQGSSRVGEQTEEDNCCSNGQGIPVCSNLDIDICCTDPTEECECSDDCIAEYAAKLCADENMKNPDSCCSNETGGSENALNESQGRVQPCGKHLQMAAAYAVSMQEEPGESSVEAAEARYVANISRLIRKCFCCGPRPFIFPGGLTCCDVRREKKNTGKPALRSGRPRQPITKTDNKSASVPIVRVSNTDVEGAPEGNKYSVVLGVVGMTCTGCESKMHDILESYPGISDVKTSFILSRAELVYDPATIPDVSEFTSYLRKRTGFVCTVLRTSLANAVDGENFILIDLDPKAEARIQALQGVNAVVPVGKNSHQVFYEPRIIGIRDILEIASSSGGCAKLATASSEEIAKKVENRHWHSLIGQTLSAAVFTIPVLIFAWSSFAREAHASEKIRYSSISMALASIVQMFAFPIYKHALQTLWYQREIDMDVLVVLSITSAYVYSLIAFAYEVKDAGSTSTLGRPVFETSSLLITLITLGRLLTLWIRRKARNIQKLDSSQTQLARVIKKVSPSGSPFKSAVTDSQEELLDIALLHYGDIIRSQENEQIVTDGIVVNGISEIDESQITGENDPVTRSKKSHVFAGSRIVNGTIEYRVTRLVSENTLSIVKNLVTSATSSRTKTQERADLLASYLTPAILAAAVIDFLIWVLVNVFFRKWAATPACINALTFGISVLAISCPCALALAVPTILAVASSVGVKKGVIFKSGTALDAGDKIQHVVFDKTGTLTTGKLAVVEEIYPGETAELPQSKIRLMTAMVTQGNKHPVSQAILERIENTTPINDNKKLSSPAKVIVGKGVELTTEHGLLRGGNPAWLGLQDHPAVKEMIESSLTIFCLTRNDTLLAIYGLSGTIRPEADEVLNQLRSMKINLHLLSGDNAPSVSRVASDLGFNTQNVRSNCQPDDKATYIRNLQSSDPKAKVCFIGDGTNDAPALSQADLGICMSNAAGIAVDAADVGILKDSLHGLLLFLDLAKRATRRIRLSLAWAVVYNVFAVLFAAGVFEAVAFRIQPSYAGVGEMVSLLPVIGISLSLRVWM